MATFKKFEDIKAWRKARELTRKIYGASNHGDFARDFGLRDRIRRAAVSVMSNIAEDMIGTALESSFSSLLLQRDRLLRFSRSSMSLSTRHISSGRHLMS